jgi:hypothetical protein
MKIEALSLPGFSGNELIIREGTAIKAIEPQKVIISGTIESPFNWLEKKSLALLECNLVVCREKGTMILTIDEKSPTADTITGALEFHEDFLRFGINSGVSSTSHELAEKIKMYRSCFKDRDIAMKLVTQLRKFTAKVNKDLEAFKDDRANYTLHKAQVVETNLPETFFLTVPIFKGQPKETFEVEININADNFACSLISPAANDYIAEHKDKIIDEQISKIKVLAPSLVIIEV